MDTSVNSTCTYTPNAIQLFVSRRRRGDRGQQAALRIALSQAALERPARVVRRCRSIPWYAARFTVRNLVAVYDPEGPFEAAPVEDPELRLCVREVSERPKGQRFEQ